MNIFVNKVLFLIVFAAITVFSVYATIRLFFIALPFLLAYALSGPLNRLVQNLHRRLGIPRGFLSFVLVLGFIALIVTLAGFGIYRGILALSGFSDHISSIAESIQSLTDSFKIIQFDVPWQSDPIVLNDVLKNFYDTLFQFVNTAVNSFLSFALNFLGALPGVGLFIFFTFLSLYFFTRDRERIVAGKEALLKKIDSPFVHHFRAHSYSTVKNYIKAQLILVSITFVISLIGLTILRVPFSPLIALGIAFVDFIPMVGPAAVYVPWILFRLLFGDFRPALGLLILYLITTLTRQTIEPKIVSSRIGAHPLITLGAMYTCYRLIGVGGFILGPILVMIVLIALNVYKSVYKKDEH
ncbi:MAG: hypothetical protein PWQ12_650 [Clostridiales bacterium]|jgi:sporulation integral membrane protein YtvI|nr:hypothetical protein [Clostridiales bacterium]